MKKLILTAAVILLTVTTAIVMRQAIRQNTRTMSLADMNIEALVQTEGGVQTKACYLELSGGSGVWREALFCDSQTDKDGNGMIYRCPSQRMGHYSELAKDRCIPANK